MSRKPLSIPARQKKRDDGLRVSKKYNPFQLTMGLFCRKIINHADIRQKPAVKKHTLSFQKYICGQVWNGRQITVVLKLFNKQGIVYSLEPAEQLMVKRWLTNLFHYKTHIESRHFTPAYIRKLMCLQDHDNEKNLIQLLHLISAKKNLPGILRELGCDSTFVQQCMQELHQKLAEVLLQCPLPKKKPKPLRRKPNLKATTGGRVKSQGSASSSEDASSGSSGGGGNDPDSLHHALIQRFDSTVTELSDRLDAHTGVDDLQDDLAALAEQKAQQALTTQLKRIIDQTVEAVVAYQRLRDAINRRHSHDQIHGKKTAFGPQDFNQKILASGAFATYIRLSLKERNFALLLPHLDSYRNFGLKNLVAKHARQELSVFGVEHGARGEREVVNAWLSYEQGRQQTSQPTRPESL